MATCTAVRPLQAANWRPLTSPGDHVSFEVDKLYGRIVAKSFRNWTLEQRLFGIEKDISQGLTQPRVLGAGRGLLEDQTS